MTLTYDHVSPSRDTLSAVQLPESTPDPCPGQQVQQELLKRKTTLLTPEIFGRQVEAKWEITSANPITKPLRSAHIHQLLPPAA